MTKHIKEDIITIEYITNHFNGYFPIEDLDLIKRACAFAQDHYTHLEHPSGKSYLQYVFAIAVILGDLHVDAIAISAAIVSPPHFMAEQILDELKRQFKEEELLKLAEDVIYVGYLEWDPWPADLAGSAYYCARREILQKLFLLAIEEGKSEKLEQHLRFQKQEMQVENLIRMFLAGVTDIRALIIKLVDRLHFIELLKDLSQSHKESIQYLLLAKITLVIYAPLAGRLGMWRLKSDLEDMSFRLLEPEIYKAIARQLVARKQEREKVINDIIPVLQAKLEECGIEATIIGRAKHIYSIYNKMFSKQMAFSEINDLLGVRIIVDTIENCYNVQSILHEYWPPLMGFYGGKASRDWIANPKENLYQSLHTTILIEGKEVEIQIRTNAMHKIAEYGVIALQDAVHWRYKESKVYKKAKILRETDRKHRSKQLAELRKVLDDEQDPTASILLKDEQEVIISMLKGLLENRIFVITPLGHVIDLPAGATPLDFAYRIHTDLGHKFTGAKVNNYAVRTDYELKSGDIVEIITSRARSRPNPEWLTKSKDEEGKSNYMFARTSQARSKISNWLNKYDEEFKARHVDAKKSKQDDIHKPRPQK